MDEPSAIQPGVTADQDSGQPETPQTQPPPQPPTVGKRILGRIPYTKAFKERLVTEQQRRFEEREKLYYGLSSIANDQKLRLRNEFQYSQLQLSEAETWIEAAWFYSMWVVFGLTIPIYVMAPLFLAGLFDATIIIGSGWWWVLRIVISVFTGVIALSIIIAPVFFLQRDEVQDFFNLTGIVACWAALLFVGSSTYLYSLRAGTVVTRPYEALVVFMIQIGLVLPLFLAMAIIFRSFRRILERRRRRFHPRGVIIDELLTMLRQMELPGFDAQWTEFSERKVLTRRLELIASAIENYFMQFFWTGSPEMDRWTDRDTTEMANGVRQVIKWVVAPNKRTKEELQARITNYLTAALSSEWGRFDRVASEKVSTRQGAKDRMLAITTALLTAAVPILLLMLLRRLNVISAEPLLTYLTVGAYVWAALSLLSRVDPQYAAKLGLLKDLTLPFGKKGGGD